MTETDADAVSLSGSTSTPSNETEPVNTNCWPASDATPETVTVADPAGSNTPRSQLTAPSTTHDPAVEETDTSASPAGTSPENTTPDAPTELPFTTDAVKDTGDPTTTEPTSATTPTPRSTPGSTTGSPSPTNKSSKREPTAAPVANPTNVDDSLNESSLLATKTPFTEHEIDEPNSHDNRSPSPANTDAWLTTSAGPNHQPRICCSEYESPPKRPNLQ